MYVYVCVCLCVNALLFFFISTEVRKIYEVSSPGEILFEGMSKIIWKVHCWNPQHSSSILVHFNWVLWMLHVIQWNYSGFDSKKSSQIVIEFSTKYQFFKFIFQKQKKTSTKISHLMSNWIAILNTSNKKIVIIPFDWSKICDAQIFQNNSRRNNKSVHCRSNFSAAIVAKYNAF